MTDELFDIRIPSFYRSGNDFAGSCSRFRYMIRLSGGQYQASVWKEDVCFEKASPLAVQSFEDSDEGFALLKAWLTEMYGQLA